jgi:hypothetical protein
MRKHFVFGLYQLIGGLWGLILLLNETFNKSLNFYQVTISVFFVVFFCLVIFSSVLIFKQNTYAKRVSIGLLVLQTIQFHLSSFGFAFIAGAYVGFEIAGDISFFFRPLFGYFSISFERTDPDFLSINIVPLVILFLLGRIYK